MDVLVDLKQGVFHFVRRLLVSETYPEETIRELGAIRQGAEHRIVGAAVANDDPAAVAGGVVEQRLDRRGERVHLLLAVQLHEAVALAMQVKDGVVADVIGDEALAHHRHVVDGGIEVEQRAGARDERIEVGGQHPVDVARAHQLRDGNVRPVDLRLVDVFADQVVTVRSAEFAHAYRISLLRRAVERVRETRVDFVDEPAGQWDACLKRAARADQQYRANPEFVYWRSCGFPARPVRVSILQA